MSLRVVGGIEGDRLAGDKNLSLVRPVRARKDLHERRLPGPIVADEGAYFPRVDSEVSAIECAHMPEPARDRTGFEQRRHQGEPSIARPMLFANALSSPYSAAVSADQCSNAASALGNLQISTVSKSC